jgi:carboxyl-terminal processing protease
MHYADAHCHIELLTRGRATPDYLAGALAPRDTTGLPSCKTDGGRKVYGGGGIFPDLPLPAPDPDPVWLDRVRADHLDLQFIGAYVDAHRAEYPSLDALAASPAVPPSAVTAFDAFAAAHGDTIPDDATARRRTTTLLTLALADAIWGSAGYFRIAAMIDPTVAAAITGFDRAASLLGPP